MNIPTIKLFGARVLVEIEGEPSKPQVVDALFAVSERTGIQLAQPAEGTLYDFIGVDGLCVGKVINVGEPLGEDTVTDMEVPKALRGYLEAAQGIFNSNDVLPPLEPGERIIFRTHNSEKVPLPSCEALRIVEARGVLGKVE